MSRANLYKPSGNAGEFDPRLFARTDFAKYNAAWALCENLVPLAEGGMMRRAGTRYLHALADQTKRGRLMSFLFSNTQAYPLVFEEEAIYFNRNQARILVANTDAAVSNGTFDTAITDWDDVSTGSTSASHTYQGATKIGPINNAEITNAFWGDGTANRRHAGQMFTTVAAGTVANAKVVIAAGSSQVTFNAVARIYTDNSGSPGTQVGTDSATVSVNSTGTFTFVFATQPSVSAATNYWLVLSDTSAGSGVRRVSMCSLQAAFASGFSDTITSISDGSNGATGGEFRMQVEVVDAGANGVLALAGDGTDVAAAEQDVATTATGTEHVFGFRVIGAPGDKIKVRVGSSSGGDQFLADMEVGTGYHVVAFTPTSSPFYLGFRNEKNKDLYVDDVAILDNQHLCLTTPYAEADLQGIVPAQSADVMYLFHQNYPTYKLLRYGHTTWSLERVAWTDGPWLTQNTTTTTLTPSATSGNGVTVAASSAVGINDGAGFSDDDVGRLIRIDNPASGIDWGWGVIVSVESSTSVTVDVPQSDRPFAATTADVNWRLGAWSDQTGWPKCGLFFEQRLFVASTTNQPQTFWASQTSDFENMSPDSEGTSTWDGTVEDDDALDYTLSSNQVNVIHAMAASADDMFFLTSGGAWLPTSVGATMTPTDITVKRQVTSSMADIQPVTIDNVVLLIQRGLRKIRELSFSFEADGYRALDMTRLSQSMTIGKIREIAFAEEQESQVFALLENGKLPAMTFRREEDVVGWSRHILGGSFSSGAAVVESIVVIPGNDGAGQTYDSTERDEVWLIVKRTIDGGTKRYVEFMERDHDGGDHAVEDAFFVDSGLTYDGSAASTITGLDHLEGEVVKVWADGDIHADRTVASGSITLASAASVVQVGLGYTHKLRSLKLEGGAEAGTAVTKRKRIVKMGFVLLDARQFSYGKDASNLIEVDLSAEDDFASGLFTGEYKIDWPEGWQDDPRIYIESDEPAPFTLLALSPETDTKEFV